MSTLPSTPITANGTYTYEANGPVQVRIGVGATTWESATVTIKIGNFTLTDLSTVSAAIIKDITLPASPAKTTISVVVASGTTFSVPVTFHEL